MKITASLATGMVAAALLLSLALGSSATLAGPIGLIDDFNTPGLAQYTIYKVLDQAGAPASNISFSDSSGALASSYAGANAAEQVLFFRNDGVTLGINEELQIDGPVTGTGNDLGIAIGATPTSLVGAGDTRALADHVFISFRSPTQLNSRGFNGGVDVGQVQNFGVDADKLFIARIGTNTIQLGWYDELTRNVSRTINAVNTNIFNNVGFYSDLRANGVGFTGLDNLTIIPEPTTFALTGMSVLGLLVARRRK